MTVTATKTLEAYLLPPTQWKQEALEEQVAAYRSAIQYAHAQDPTTKTAVKDALADHNLSWQAKDALANHLSQLNNSDDLEWEQPVRYTKRAAKIDRDLNRTHELAWRVPMPGRGTSFWIPLHINPEQEELWHRVERQPTRPDRAEPEEVDDALSVGQVRLQRDGSRWVLHVTVDIELEEKTNPDSGDVTSVGFDVGISQLLVGCALEDGKPQQPFIYSGGTLRHARQKQNDATQRVQRRNSTHLDGELWERYQNRIDDEIETASRRAVNYAAGWENPVIVLEDIAGIREDIDMARIHQWAFYRLQTRLEEKACEEGIPVRYVSPDYTSQICHACHRVGHRPEQAEFRCPYEDCWVSEYQADINAATNVARRLDPWGESLPLEMGAGDDVPRNGAPVTAPQDTSRSEDHLSNPGSWGRQASDDNARFSTGGGAGTGQMTLDAYTS